MPFRRELLPPRPSLVHRIAVGCIVGAVPLALLWGLAQPGYSCRGGSKVDVAKVTVKMYAFEAYPQWREANPDRACPSSLLELRPWMTTTDVRDPWGGGYVMRCETPTFGVFSAGEDGIYGTEDDIKSWE
jgi:hypothetical protein